MRFVAMVGEMGKRHDNPFFRRTTETTIMWRLKRLFLLTPLAIFEMTSTKQDHKDRTSQDEEEDEVDEW